MFVYIFMGAHIAPLTVLHRHFVCNTHFMLVTERWHRTQRGPLSLTNPYSRKMYPLVLHCPILSHHPTHNPTQKVRLTPLAASPAGSTATDCVCKYVWTTKYLAHGQDHFYNKSPKIEISFHISSYSLQSSE